MCLITITIHFVIKKFFEIITFDIWPYRYGFNGKENDNEVKDEGNQQDYGMRVYDPRIGKFLSVDPLFAQFADFSPYHSYANNPIVFIDENGESPEFGGPGDDVKVKSGRTIVRVKLYIDKPVGQRTAEPIRPKSGSQIWGVAKFIAKGGLFLKLLFSDANYGYAGPGANGHDETAIKEFEYITSDPSKLDDHYLKQVKRRLEEGTATDQERNYIDEIYRRGILKSAGGKNPYLNETRERLLKLRDNFKEMIADHKNKIDEFIKDPKGNTSPEKLKEAMRDNPTDEVLMKRLLGRVSALEKQIKKQEGELAKVEEAIIRTK